MRALGKTKYQLLGDLHHHSDSSSGAHMLTVSRASAVGDKGEVLMGHKGFHRQYHEVLDSVLIRLETRIHK